MTDNVLLLLRSMRDEHEARFDQIMQELSMIRQQMLLLEAAISGKQIAARTALLKKER
jgi:hypothetical protein